MNKTITISGKNSQIGNKIDHYLSERGFNVTQLDVITDSWKRYDFNKTDAIVHVAAIVHQPRCNDWSLYKRVNVDLAVEIAKEAKAQGVKQFIFLSTMGVYGRNKELKDAIITGDTPPNPISMYGRSKLMAEEELLKLSNGHFNVTIVRLPNVYGGTRNDYVRKIASLIKYLPVIPYAYTDIKQSMLYMDNLAELIKELIINNKGGIVMPQDGEAISSVQLLSAIRSAKGYKVRYSKALGFVVRAFCFLPFVKKVYGGVAYDANITRIDGIDYYVIPFEEAINKMLK